MEKAGLSREDQRIQANHRACHARVLQRLNRGSKGGSTTTVRRKEGAPGNPDWDDGHGTC